MEDTKICSTCKKVLPTTEFWKRNSSRDGLSYKCKHCALQSVKKFKAEHPDYQRTYEKRYRQKNKRKIREYQREWVKAKRVQEGKKNNDRSGKYLGNKWLEAKPLASYLISWQKSTKYLRKDIAVMCHVDWGFINNLIEEKTKYVLEADVEKILFGLDEQHMWHELYPVKEER